MNSQNPYYDEDMQNKLIKKAVQREIKASVIYGILMVLTMYLASAVFSYLWLFVSQMLPVFKNSPAIKLYDMAGYTAQFLLPLAVYKIVSGKRLKDIYFADIRYASSESKEKITLKSILVYFPIAFSLSQISANISSFFSELLSDIGAAFSENLVMDPSAFSDPVSVSYAEFAMDLIAMAVLPAILEELIFRGVFLGEFLKYGKTFAIVMSAFFFSSVHGSWEQMMFSFVFGTVFGYIAVKTGSLTAGIIIHFMNNAYICTAEFLLNRFGTDVFAVVFATVNLLLIVGGFSALIYKIIKGSFGYYEKKDSEKEPCELSGAETFSVFVSPIMLIYIGFVMFETMYIYIAYNLA